MAQARNGSHSLTVSDKAMRKTDVQRPTYDEVAPKAGGLFDPMREHDACGVGFIVNLKNKPSQKIVQNGLAILENLEHRGAVGADPLMGDGAGILVQTPHAFFDKVLPFPLPHRRQVSGDLLGRLVGHRPAGAGPHRRKLGGRLVGRRSGSRRIPGIGQLVRRESDGIGAESAITEADGKRQRGRRSTTM